MAGLLDLIKNKLGYTAPQQNVFTSRVNPQLQRKFYAEQEDPQKAFAESLVTMAGPKQAYEKIATKARRQVNPEKRQKLIDLANTVRRTVPAFNPNEVLDFTVRPAARTTVGITQATNRPDGTYTPETKLEKLFLGNAPVRPTLDNDISRKLQEKGINPKTAGLMASGLALGGILADATPAGKASKLAKAGKVDELGRVLKVKVRSTDKAVKVSQKVLGDVDPKNIQDITAIDANFKPVTRIIDKAFGKDAPNVKRRLIEPLDAAKGALVDERNQLALRLKTEVVDRLGIKKGSAESRLVQIFGEKKMDLPTLQRQAPRSWGKIVEADKWFRQEYDRLLDEVNSVRSQIYPNNPDKIIPRRGDYYRHFQELTGFEGVKNLFEGPSNIPTALAGISDSTQPKGKFLSFAQKRLGDKSTEDAVGGFIDYIRASTYAKHVDPHISKFQGVAKELEDAATATDSPELGSRLAEFFRDYSGDLAGKTNALDRGVQKVVGRKAFQILDAVNTRVKLNTILGNLSSSVAQAGNVPQMIGNFGAKNFAAGFTDVLRNTGKGDRLINDSNFIKERYAKDVADSFDSGVLASTKKFAGWVTQALDEISTKSGWYAAHRQALEQGVSNPVKYADNAVRDMVAGRGIGEVPLVQKSRIFQLVAPFQLEVQNLWQVMGKNVSEREFGKLVKFMVAAYGFNKAAEEIRGNGVTFDPIQAVISAYDTFEEEENKGIGALKAGGRLAGEVLSNTVGGQTLAGLYPEYGIKFGDETVTREELFGDEDPTRFGGGLIAAKGIQDPLYKLLPSYGGNQIKKTIEGGKTVARGYSETKKGDIKYPVESTPENVVKSLAFGSPASDEGKEYYKKDRRPLGEKQTETAKKTNIKEIYEKVIAEREAKKTNTETEAKSVSAAPQPKKPSTDAATNRAVFNLKKARAKRENDLPTAVEVYKNRIDFLGKQLREGELTDAQKASTNAELERISAQIKKYALQGGFTKPKKVRIKKSGKGKGTRGGKKVKVVRSAAPAKTRFAKFKAPSSKIASKNIRLKTANLKFNKPKSSKLSVASRGNRIRIKT